MKTTVLQVLGCVATLLVVTVARADRIELTNGSVIVGKILSAEDGKFTVETEFAGKIEIKQDMIQSFSTDAAVNVGLKSGSAVLGRVEPTATGLAVVATDGTTTATPAGVTAVWAPGTDSPEVRKQKEAADKLKRKWAFEAAAGISGRTGVAERFSSVIGFKATLESSQDKLLFVANAERARDNGVETANRQFGSADYSSFFSSKDVWYTRTSLEHDAIKELDLRSMTAAGLGHKLIKRDNQDLEARLGVNYIYEAYANGTTFDSPGLDVALIHSVTFKTSKLSSMVGYTPAFNDFANYRVHFESAYELPITAALWKLKLGVNADYTSKPQPGIEKFDLLYFTSLILNWK
jgi:Protein of unknown function, DUF481